MASKTHHSTSAVDDGKKRGTASGSRNSRLQQAHSLPPQEQQPSASEAIQSTASSAPVNTRNDSERETRSGAGDDFSGSGPETSERAHQNQIDDIAQAHPQGDGKVEVDTRQEPKYHSGKQTHR